MDKSDLRIEQLQQYLDKKKGVVESDIKEYNQQLGKNYLHFFDWHADVLRIRGRDLRGVLQHG